MNAIGRIVAVGIVFALALYAFANVSYFSHKKSVAEEATVCTSNNVDGKMVIICNK